MNTSRSVVEFELLNSTQVEFQNWVKLKRSIQFNWIESDSRFNSINLTNWLELDCRPTFYQIPYQILYQSDQTFYQTLYHVSHHVFHHISHHVSHHIFHHVFYHVFYHILYQIFYHIFYQILYQIDCKIDCKKIWKKIKKKYTIFSIKNWVQTTQLNSNLMTDLNTSKNYSSMSLN